MNYVLVTPPAAEPIDFAAAEAHLRLESGDGGDYLDSLILGARQYVEEVTGRALVTQTWDCFLDRFPCDRTAIVLGKGRLQAAEATETTPSTLPVVTYLDINGALQTLDSSKYQVDTANEPGRIVLAPGCYWPETECGRVNAVRVRFVAGYGDADAVPQPIKQAMLLLVAHMYENREPEVVAPSISRFQFAVDALLSTYRLSWVE